MSVTDLILQAKLKKATELFFLVGSEPRARIQSEWVQLKSSPILSAEWGILVQSFLSGQQISLLESDSSVVGEGQFGGGRIGFSFYQKDGIRRLVLNMGDMDSGAEYLPPMPFIEATNQLEGFMLLSGPRDSQLTRSLQAILNKLNQEKVFNCLVISDNSFMPVKEEKASFIYKTSSHYDWSNPELLKGIDLVVIDSVHSEDKFAWAMETAENGIGVVYSMHASSSLASLKRCYSAAENKFGKHGVARLAEILRIVYGQVALKGIANDIVLANELLTIKPHIRQYIEQQDTKSLEAIFKGNAESAGVLSLNQSLMQHLVRRRIDLKTAFAASRDPENLDLLLKKVGV